MIHLYAEVSAGRDGGDLRTLVMHCAHINAHTRTEEHTRENPHRYRHTSTHLHMHIYKETPTHIYIHSHNRMGAYARNYEHMEIITTSSLAGLQKYIT